MMPHMKQGLRGLGRRITCQVIKQRVVDHEAVQAGVDMLRATVLMVPMPARKIAFKPEGQRTWKWWSGTSSTRLELGWYLKAANDGKRLYEVISQEDWSQARVYNYDFAEAPR